MRSILHIFPSNYPHPHDEEDLLFELKDILRHADSPMDIIHTINKIECPYYRKAIATLVPNYWHSMEQQGTEPAVFYDGDGDWRITWMNVDHDMRAIIKTANAQQLQLEQPNPSTPYTLHTTPKNNTTMPLFINKHEGTIHHNEYHNCTIYQGVALPHNEPEENKTHPVVVDAENAPAHYSTYLRRQLGLGKTDDEVQNNLKNAALAGATALARYLTSNEGKIYFDFRGQNKSNIIATLNQELGTSISDKAFCAALNRNGLQL